MRPVTTRRAPRKPLRHIVLPDDRPEIAIVPLTKGQVAIIDRADAPLVAGRFWQAAYHPARDAYYAVSNPSIGYKKQKTTFMHKVILGDACGESLEGDHKDGDTLNNRRQNLRPATRMQNSQNRKRRCDNSSGRKGVSYDRQARKWVASIGINGRWTRLGRFLTFEEAVAVREAAERAAHGEFARPPETIPPFPWASAS